MTTSEKPSEQLMLYHSDLCGYCWKVRGVIDDLGIDVELRDIGESRDSASELREARGRTTVPVLRRLKADGESEWMPESSDIIEFLRSEYGSG